MAWFRLQIINKLRIPSINTDNIGLMWWEIHDFSTMLYADGLWSDCYWYLRY